MSSAGASHCFPFDLVRVLQEGRSMHEGEVGGNRWVWCFTLLFFREVVFKKNCFDTLPSTRATVYALPLFGMVAELRLVHTI